jgi:hypothetical protein
MHPQGCQDGGKARDWEKQSQAHGGFDKGDGVADLARKILSAEGSRQVGQYVQDEHTIYLHQSGPKIDRDCDELANGQGMNGRQVGERQ